MPEEPQQRWNAYRKSKEDFRFSLFLVSSFDTEFDFLYIYIYIYLLKTESLDNAILAFWLA